MNFPVEFESASSRRVTLGLDDFSRFRLFAGDLGGAAPVGTPIDRSCRFHRDRATGFSGFDVDTHNVASNQHLAGEAGYVSTADFQRVCMPAGTMCFGEFCGCDPTPPLYTDHCRCRLNAPMRCVLGEYTDAGTLHTTVVQTDPRVTQLPVSPSSSVVDVTYDLDVPHGNDPPVHPVRSARNWDVGSCRAVINGNFLANRVVQSLDTGIPAALHGVATDTRHELSVTVGAMLRSSLVSLPGTPTDSLQLSVYESGLYFPFVNFLLFPFLYVDYRATHWVELQVDTQSNAAGVSFLHAVATTVDTYDRSGGDKLLVPGVASQLLSGLGPGLADAANNILDYRGIQGSAPPATCDLSASRERQIAACAEGPEGTPFGVLPNAFGGDVHAFEAFLQAGDSGFECATVASLRSSLSGSEENATAAILANSGLGVCRFRISPRRVLVTENSALALILSEGPTDRQEPLIRGAVASHMLTLPPGVSLSCGDGGEVGSVPIGSIMVPSSCSRPIDSTTPAYCR